MIAVFFPLVLLAFATIEYSGSLLLFPSAFLIFWVGTTFAVWYYWLPKLVLGTPHPDGFNSLLSIQNRLQWLTVAWIALLQACSAPGYFISPWLVRALPQMWPMLISAALYLVLMWAMSGVFHRAFNDLLDLDQSPEEYFRARLTLPILFFPPMILWMGFEDVLSRYSSYSALSEIWTLALAPVFFLGLYLFSPYLFNLAWHAVPMQDEPLEQEIRLLAQRSHTPIAGIRVWDTFKEPLANAAVAGLADRYRFVYVTHYLLEVLGRREVVAVIAHELAHFRLGHVWTYLLFTLDLIFLSIAIKLALIIHFPEIAHTYGQYSSYIDPIFFLGGFLLIFTALTRFSERQADRFAAALVGPELFSRAMENLQEHIGVPQRKLPWWLETHPEFDDRIKDSRSWAGVCQELITQAKTVRLGMFSVALLAILLIWPNAKHAVRFSLTEDHIATRQYQAAAQGLALLEKQLGRHPHVVSFYGKLSLVTNQWFMFGLYSAEAHWGLPERLVMPLQVFHHPVAPEVAFQFQFMEFMLKAFHLGGVHRVSLFDEGFDLVKALFGK
jgi:Zn-dependent protease with chaperone function